MKLGSWDQKNPKTTQDVEGKQEKRDLPGSLLHKAIFALQVVLLYVVLIIFISYIPAQFFEEFEEEKKKEFDWMWWCLVRSMFLIDLLSIFCLPNGYRARPLPNLINEPGVFAIVVHAAVSVLRAWHYWTLAPPDFPIYVAVSVAVFLMLTLRQIYACCVYIFAFEPYLRNDSLRRDYKLTASTGSVCVLSSGAFEITLRNDGSQNWNVSDCILTRTAKRGYRTRSQVSFNIPENVSLAPGEFVKLIPEIEPTAFDSIQVHGFRCFGFDTEDSIETRITRKSKEVAKTIEKYRLIGKTWSDDGTVAGKLVGKKIWTSVVMSTYKDSGYLDSEARVV